MPNTDKTNIELTTLEFNDLKEILTQYTQQSRIRAMTSGSGTETKKTWEERAEKGAHMLNVLNTQPGSDEEN